MRYVIQRLNENVYSLRGVEVPPDHPPPELELLLEPLLRLLTLFERPTR